MRHVSPLEVALLVIAGACLILAWRVRWRGRRYSHAYSAYIHSPEWRNVRRKALARAGYRCEHRGLFGRCHATYGLQVHHRHYRQLGREWDGRDTNGECLQVLCRTHHVRADVKRRRRARAW